MNDKNELGPVEEDNLFKLINSDNIQPMIAHAEIIEEDSRLGELNRAFICEHSEVLKESKPIDVDGSLVTPTKERL